MEKQLKQRLSHAARLHGLRMLHAKYKRDRDEALADRNFPRADKLERDMDGILLEISREEAKIGH